LAHLAKPPGTVLDVGGAAGVYSAWLGSLGYETHLVDPVPRHVDQARANRAIASAAAGDARRLDWSDDSFDYVLMLGPLYHLTERPGRLTALREARRVLRRGGVLFAAAISRFASLLDSLVRGFIDDPRFVPVLERDLKDGQHRNPTGDPNFFTTAFFHRPEELKEEVNEAGFLVIELAVIEGVAWLARDFEARWSDPVRRDQLLALCRAVEREPALLGLSPHLLIAARKA
jgi:SAM-dependent methyltransferase